MGRFEIALDDGKPAYFNTKLPEYRSSKSASVLLYCADRVIIPARSARVIHSGVKVNVADDECFLVSNINPNLKRGIYLSNGIEVFDAEYDGEVMCMFMNPSDDNVIVEKDELFAKGMFVKIQRPDDL